MWKHSVFFNVCSAGLHRRQECKTSEPGAAAAFGCWKRLFMSETRFSVRHEKTLFTHMTQWACSTPFCSTKSDRKGKIEPSCHVLFRLSVFLQQITSTPLYPFIKQLTSAFRISLMTGWIGKKMTEVITHCRDGGQWYEAVSSCSLRSRKLYWLHSLFSAHYLVSHSIEQRS